MALVGLCGFRVVPRSEHVYMFVSLKRFQESKQFELALTSHKSSLQHHKAQSCRSSSVNLEGSFSSFLGDRLRSWSEINGVRRGKDPKKLLHRLGKPQEIIKTEHTKNVATFGSHCSILWYECTNVECVQERLRVRSNLWVWHHCPPVLAVGGSNTISSGHFPLRRMQNKEGDTLEEQNCMRHLQNSSSKAMGKVSPDHKDWTPPSSEPCALHGKDKRLLVS